jgi:ABC-type glycerol-3-phosphate transport system substrate-binding protein
VYNLNKNKTKMKKVIAIFAITALVACGGASTEATTDSTAVAVDSTVVTVDTAVAPAVDTVIAK